MKKIAIIRNSYSYDFGGGEKFPVNLAVELNKVGYKTIVFSANSSTLKNALKNKVCAIKSPWWSFQNFSGIRVFLVPAYCFWQVYLFLWYLTASVRYKIDIFHPQSRDDFIAATFAAKLLHKKVIWTDHADLKYVFANHKKWYKNTVGKFVYLASKLADHITLVSFSEKKLIEAALGQSLPAKYKVIHNGVVDSYKPKKISNKNTVFVATSRLVKAKGIGELLEAFGALNDKNSLLRLYGDGPDAEKFKAQYGGIKNIEFVGHIDDVSKELQSANVFVHPSYHEGFSLSLVEAAMHGLPIIACKVGGNPEIVKDGVNGILVTPNSAEELVEAMRILINNPKLRGEMGEASRKIYLKDFQFDKIVKEKFIPLYE